MKDRSAFQPGAKPPVFISVDGRYERVLPVCPSCRKDLTKTAIGNYMDYKISKLITVCKCGAELRNSDIVRVQEGSICRIEC
jgi:hypothetical protein